MELLLRVELPDGPRDVACRPNGETTIAELAQLLLDHTRAASVPRPTIERLSRGRQVEQPDRRVLRTSLCSGDRVAIVSDAGIAIGSGPAAQARLIVADGPGAGKEFPLPPGVTTIGRSSQSDIRLDDPLVSRRHANVLVSDEIQIADQGAVNVTTVNGEPVVGTQRVRPGDIVRFGETTARFEHLHGADASHAGNEIRFNRPPRIHKPFSGRAFELPAPPQRPGKRRLPMITAIAPVILGLVLYLITRSLTTVLFIALSPIMILGSWYEGKRSGRHDYAERVAEHEDLVRNILTELTDELNAEIRQRYADSPGPIELEEMVLSRDPRLWERTPGRPLFLDARVGLAPTEPASTLTIATGGHPDDRATLASYPERYEMLPDVPALLSLGCAGGTGIGGPRDRTHDIARSAIVQAAVLQSPVNLSICILTAAELVTEFGWAKWLPHCRSGSGPLSSPRIADSADACLALVAELNAIISERAESRQSSDRVQFPHQLLVVVDSDVPIARPRLNTILEHGRHVGVHPLWISGDPNDLPSTLGQALTIETNGAFGSIGDVGSGEHLRRISLEGLSAAEAEGIARRLAPVIDVSAGGSDDSSLPRQISLVDLLGGPALLDGTDLVHERWQESRSSTGLRGPVGATADGILTLDLRHDGPHGLIGGTTGAGKSEFLQSLIAGMAATLSPERITFLLVDYKGGSAFKECTALPHTVGMITDLTPALVQRALVSLRAELHRRERLLGIANAKDLVEMEKRRHPDTPPSLVIVIDEFAALAREVPEFVEGAVDIAQRGRSLGMHLLLATQRPAGVVTSNIKANTNLRVALRMASEDESVDVVDSPAAALIDRSFPGRGVVRLGPTELIPFQSAYVGGVTEGDGPTLAVDVGDFAPTGVTWVAMDKPEDHTTPELPSDLERLTRVLSEAATENGIEEPRRPWLNPLPSNVDLLELPRPVSDTAIVLGLLDDPEYQTRDMALFRPDVDGAMLLYGTGGSGKTVALRTIAASAGITKDRSAVTVHALDFAGRGLDMIQPLPHVGSVITGDDYDAVTRLLTDVRDLIAQRADRFSRSRAASLSEYRASGPEPVDRWIILLDGFDNFLANYERVDRGIWAELLPRLVADGRQVGVHFVLTGTRRGSFPMALTSAVQRRVVFRMASEEDYHSLNVDPALFDQNSPAGRCLIGGYVTQLGIVGGAAATALEADAHRHLGEALRAHSGHEAQSIRVLPDLVPLDPMIAPASGVIPLMMNDRFEFHGPSLDRDFLVIGPGRSGRSTTLAGALKLLRSTGLREVGAVTVRDRQHQEFQAATPGEAADRFRELGSQAPLDGFIVIDDLHHLVETEADYALKDLLDASPNLRVLAACDAATARKAYLPLIGALREGAEVVVLQPDLDMDADILGVPIPRLQRRFGPGRGVRRAGDAAEVVQVVS